MDFLRRHRARIQAAGTICAALVAGIGLVWLTELLLPLTTWTDLYEVVRLVVVALLSALLAVRFADRRAYRKGDQDGYQRGWDAAWTKAANTYWQQETGEQPPTYLDSDADYHNAYEWKRVYLTHPE